MDHLGGHRLHRLFRGGRHSLGDLGTLHVPEFNNVINLFAKLPSFIGLDLSNAKLLPITYSKNVKGKVTSAVLYGGGKYMVLAMGSNNLPKITQDKFNILLFR